MKNIALTPEEELLASKIRDMLDLCDKTGSARFSAFLDERQQMVANVTLNREGRTNTCFYAGYASGERQMLGAFPFFEDPDISRFPIAPVTVQYRKQDVLTHRDFLGSLMALQIRRDAVGDILVGEGLSVLLLTEPVAELIVLELHKVGRVGVTLNRGMPATLPEGQEYLPIEGTVSSLRLDAIVSLLTNQSREASSRLIRQGLVSVNAIPMNTISETLSQGDKISIRGHGKFILETIGGLTKKGRVHLTCKKYL